MSHSAGAPVRTPLAAREATAPYIGQWGPYRLTREAVTSPIIWRFCEVAEDANPMYWDEEFAKSTRFGRLIAPPQSILSLLTAWWSPDFVAAQLEREAKQLSDSAGVAPGAVMDVVRGLGYSVSTVSSNEMEYLAPFGPGDGRIKSRSMTVDVSAEKQTRPGRGVFVTSVMEFRTELGDRPIARATLTILQYDSSTPRSAQIPGAAGVLPSPLRGVPE